MIKGSDPQSEESNKSSIQPSYADKQHKKQKHQVIVNITPSNNVIAARLNFLFFAF